MRTALFCLLALVTGCASAKLTEKGARVRFVSTSPHDCKYIAEVYGHYRSDSVSRGLLPFGKEEPFSRIDLKNKAGELGADTVELGLSTRQYGVASGEAYRCEK